MNTLRSMIYVQIVILVTVIVLSITAVTALCNNITPPDRVDNKQHQYCNMRTEGRVVGYTKHFGVIVYINDNQSWVPPDAKHEDWPVGTNVIVVFKMRNATYDKGNPYVLDTFEVVGLSIERK